MRIAGVPEHFNRAWRALAADGALRFEEVPEGTGRMLDLLTGGDCDIALLLTEGAVAGAARGLPVAVLGTWVETPLHWGVHVPAASDLRSPADIRDLRIAISRYGSGSHLMGALYAESREWKSSPDYVVVNTLAGAREAFASGEADVFLWERATTAPLVASGEFRRVDVMPTPWPCFVACVRANLPASQLEDCRALLQAALVRANALATHTDAAEQFAAEYGLDRGDTAEWLAATGWPREVGISQTMLDDVSAALHRVGLIDSKPETAQLIAR